MTLVPSKLAAKAKPPASQARSLALVCGAIAGLAAVNWFAGRAAERRTPPDESFIIVKGVKLHYSDRGDGSPIVLIHGNAVTGSDWIASGIAEELQKSHRVIILDRPGCGFSERPHGHLWTAEQQAELIHAALTELGVRNPLVVGHSFGALVALAYALCYTTETAAIVIISGYYFWSVRADVMLSIPTALPILGDLLRYTISPLLSRLQIPLLKKLMFAPAPVTARFEREYRPDLISRPSQIRAMSIDGVLMMEEVLRLHSFYKDIALPVTIVAGAADKIVSARSSLRLHKEIGHSTLKIFDGVGHMVHHSATAEVIKIIEDASEAYDLVPVPPVDAATA